jgi:hypothetical protein
MTYSVNQSRLLVIIKIFITVDVQFACVKSASLSESKRLVMNLIWERKVIWWLCTMHFVREYKSNQQICIKIYNFFHVKKEHNRTKTFSSSSVSRYVWRLTQLTCVSFKSFFTSATLFLNGHFVNLQSFACAHFRSPLNFQFNLLEVMSAIEASCQIIYGCFLTCKKGSSGDNWSMF